MRSPRAWLSAILLCTAVTFVSLPAHAVKNGVVRKAVTRNLARFGVSPATMRPTTRSYIWRMDNMQPKNGPPAPVSTSRYGFNVTKSGQIPTGKSSGGTKPITRDVHFLINNGRILGSTRTTHTSTHYWRSDNPGQLTIDYTLKPNHRSRFVSLAKGNGIEVRQGDAVRTQVKLEQGKWVSTSYLLNDRGVLFVYGQKPASVQGWKIKQLPGKGKQQRWIRVRE